MLVIIHQHHAVGRGGDCGIVPFVVVRGNRHIQLHTLGVQVGSKFVQQDKETGLAFFREGFEIHHQAAVFVAVEKVVNLITKFVAGVRVIQESADIHPIDSVKIVDQRKYFHAGVFRLQKRHDFLVHRMHRIALYYVKKLIGQRIDALQPSVGRQHGKPFGEEQIDLAGIFPQGGETGGIPGDVESRAYALFRIQLDLRRRSLRLAMAAMRQQAAPFAGLLFFFFFQCVVGLFLRLPYQLRKRLAAQSGIDEKNDDQGEADAEHIE